MASLSKYKNDYKLDAQAKASRHIEATYPLYKQMNINELQGYIQADKDTMWVFINAVRNRCNSLEATIDSQTTTGDVEAVVIDYSDII